MSFSLRFSAVALACCLSSQTAFANIIQADASLVDAAIPIEDDAQAVPQDAGRADADASSEESDASPAADPITVTDGSTVIKIPGATGEQFSAPNFEGDDGCASTGASTGSFSTIAAALFAMLALAWSRRRR